MNIELRRIRHRPETIDGQIWIDGQRICDCAENAAHCLPEGSFQVDIVKCHQHLRKMPVVCLEGTTAKRSVTGGNALGLQTQAENTCLEGSTLPPCNQCPKLPYVGNNTNMPCDCVQIAPGNGVYNRTDGSIIVGNYIAPGCLSHPLEAFHSLYERIRKNIERGNPVQLIISSI